MSDFKNELQGLNINEYQAGQMIPYDTANTTNSDQARQCGWNCFHCHHCHIASVVPVVGSFRTVVV
jgi:heterocycloanthracin/sonorensin family bacteriocin